MQPSIQLNDIFHTFQGEGKNWGRRSVFVRLPFCNYSCTWCDTDYNSVNFKFDDKEFLFACNSESHKFAVVTGGEPTVNKNFDRIIQLLYNDGFEIAVETNGSNYPLSASLIKLITISPKRFAPRNLPEFYIDPKYIEEAKVRPSDFEFKYVVDEGFDFKLITDLRKELPNARISLSPEYNDLKGSFAKIEAFCKLNPSIRYSLQTHKWLDIK